jgi:AcrR family transcriptional regulator
VADASKTGAPKKSVVVKSMPRKLGRPPKVKAHDTRRRILDVARGVYADLGYEVATNKDIADLAHMTTAALYYHFPSKRHLYLAVHEDARERVYGRFNEVLDPKATFADQLLTILTATHQLNEEDPTLARFLGAARVDMRRRAELLDAYQHRGEYRQQFFDRIVDAGVRTGEIKAGQRDMMSAFILTVITGMTDALSDDQQLHSQAIEAVRAVIAGNLVQEPRAVRRRKPT